MPTQRLKLFLFLLALIKLVGCDLASTLEIPNQTSIRIAHEQALQHGAKVVLVTGAAGFIGYNLAKNLTLANPYNIVVGFDSFNDYYDVQLKIDRAYDLHLHKVWMYHADLRNTSFLSGLFKEFNFTHVVHLGAQAGVRYSLEHPLVYVDSNIEGHQAILDVISEQNTKVHLTYASSSSVYGKESTIPFHLSANVDRPGNMYAMTKRAAEVLSLRHCLMSGIHSIGLRFFTVYGPWGRPDMAVYKFAESILEGRKVPMFQPKLKNGSAQLGRDFTYIDDIIGGIVSAMDYNPTECGAVFNLGFGDPVSVPRLVASLEKELGLRAEVELLPLPPTEILKTWADISVSRRFLGFRPTTDLTTGIKKFVAWFKSYWESRRDPGNQKTADARQWYQSLLDKRGRRQW